MKKLYAVFMWIAFAFVVCGSSHQSFAKDGAAHYSIYKIQIHTDANFLNEDVAVLAAEAYACVPVRTAATVNKGYFGGYIKPTIRPPNNFRRIA